MIAKYKYYNYTFNRVTFNNPKQNKTNNFQEEKQTLYLRCL